MKIAETIDLGEWVRDPRVMRVMDGLNLTQPRSALFVGGCVRNSLLKKPVKDVDIAVQFEPDVVQRILNEAGVKTIPTGIEHGTITAVIEGMSFEITSLRKDVETDGRRAVIAFTQDWAEDARRRDFTMNTLLSDIHGNIYDPTGHGLEDLKAGRVVFVGQADQRIAEDVLRILRFFRFHLYYGHGAPDELALVACKNAAHKINVLSRERITQEFFKLLEHDDPRDVMGMMYDCGILMEFVNPRDWQKLAFYPQALVERLCVINQTVDKMNKFFVIPKTIQKLIGAIRSTMEQNRLVDEQTLKQVMYYHGRDVARHAFTIQHAHGEIPDHFIVQGQDILAHWDIPVFPITGDDLIAQGYSPGKALGEELKRREQEWVETGF